MNEVALVYSSHDRCRYIHESRIVQRALDGKNNKRILFLPFSEPVREGDEFRAQHFGYSKFEWFFNYYKGYGLESVPFYYSSNLSAKDIEILIDYIKTSEVVILGGGNPILGIMRFKNIGKRFLNDESIFKKLFLERAENGLLTAGFSAGADQLCEYLSSSLYSPDDHIKGFQLAKDIIVTLHYEDLYMGRVSYMASLYPKCMSFGLPNDSALAVSYGKFASGKTYQAIEFILDKTWDKPEDAYHIKTRYGVRITHIYHNGKNWIFNGGDMMLRVMDENLPTPKAWIATGGKVYDYESQTPSQYKSLGEVIQNN